MVWCSLRREILQPRDMITIPTEDNSYLHFCGLFCLSVFRHNKKQPDKAPDKWADKKQEKVPEKVAEKPVEKQPERSICSVCKISNRVRRRGAPETRGTASRCLLILVLLDPRRLSTRSTIKVVCTGSAATPAL